MMEFNNNDYNNYNTAGNSLNYYSGTNTLTSGYMQQGGEREKFCPRDGNQFNGTDNYCAKCGRAIGFISGYNSYPPYQITWGSQVSPNNQEQMTLWSQAAQEAKDGPNK